LKYPYEEDNEPDMSILLHDIGRASLAMQERMDKHGIKLNTEIFLKINGVEIAIHTPSLSNQKLVSELDNKLLRRIFDRKAHWNNAEGGCHIEFIRTPNIYEFDAHTSLQFFHL